MTRDLYVIAREIQADWQKVNFAAKPYLDAMYQLQGIRDNFGVERADMIVRYFLSNANSWRGETARRIKIELKGMLL